MISTRSSLTPFPPAQMYQTPSNGGDYFEKQRNSAATKMRNPIQIPEVAFNYNKQSRNNKIIVNSYVDTPILDSYRLQPRPIHSKSYASLLKMTNFPTPVESVTIQKNRKKNI